MTGPKCGSRCMPRIISVPPLTISCTRTPCTSAPRALSSSLPVFLLQRCRIGHAKRNRARFGLVQQPGRLNLERNRVADRFGRRARFGNARSQTLARDRDAVLRQDGF